MQVELDALPPDVLRQLFRDAIGDFLEMSAVARVERREARERKALQRVARKGGA